MKTLITLVLLLGMGCSQCLAQSGSEQKHIDKIKAQVSKYLEKGTEVSVETYDQRKVWGAINEADADTFVMTVGGKPTTLQYAGVKKIKAPMSPATKSRIAMASVLGGLTGLLFLFALNDR